MSLKAAEAYLLGLAGNPDPNMHGSADEARAFHEALKKTKSKWNKLKLVGIQSGDPTDPEAVDLELRNCKCGSTLAKRLVLLPPQ